MFPVFVPTAIYGRQEVREDVERIRKKLAHVDHRGEKYYIWRIHSRLYGCTQWISCSIFLESLEITP